LDALKAAEQQLAFIVATRPETNSVWGIQANCEVDDVAVARSQAGIAISANTSLQGFYKDSVEGALASHWDGEEAPVVSVAREGVGDESQVVALANILGRRRRFGGCRS
jgi:hypothetical protein